MRTDNKSGSTNPQEPAHFWPERWFTEAWEQAKPAAILCCRYCPGIMIIKPFVLPDTDKKNKTPFRTAYPPDVTLLMPFCYLVNIIFKIVQRCYFFIQRGGRAVEFGD